jgi:hypothetical protein
MDVKNVVHEILERQAGLGKEFDSDGHLITLPINILKEIAKGYKFKATDKYTIVIDVDSSMVTDVELELATKGYADHYTVFNLFAMNVEGKRNFIHSWVIPQNVYFWSNYTNYGIWSNKAPFKTPSEIVKILDGTIQEIQEYLKGYITKLKKHSGGSFDIKMALKLNKVLKLNLNEKDLKTLFEALNG